MGYKIGIDKKQISFMPMCLDDIIEENHICRVISAFTERLNMEKLEYKYLDLSYDGLFDENTIEKTREEIKLLKVITNIMYSLIIFLSYIC